MAGGYDRLFYESIPFTIAVLLWVALVGLFVGDALMLVAWRLTHGERVFSGASHCDCCGRTLSLREIIPIVGWFRTQGQCDECGWVVPLLYPVGELACSLILVTVVFRYSITVEAIEYVLLACVLFVAAVCDLQDYTIPNALVIWGVLIRLAYIVWVGISSGAEQAVVLGQDSVIGTLVTAGPVALALALTETMMRREVLGGADLNLLALSGMYLGWQLGLLCVILAALIWALASLVFARIGVETQVRGNPNVYDSSLGPFADVTDVRLEITSDEDLSEPLQMVPLGPAIALATWMVVMLGIPTPLWSLPIL